MNAHVAPEIADILNAFAMQTPYKVDDLPVPLEFEPDLCIWCGKEDCARCETLYDISENGKHE